MKYLVYIIIFFISFNIFSDDYMLEFTDGTIQYREGNRWVEAFIGDYIPGTAEIKMPADTFAEFRKNNIKLTLTEQGTYMLDNLFNKSEEIADWSIASLIGDKFEKLVGINEEDVDVTHMAVRGAEVEGLDSNDELWLDEHTELINEIKKQIENSNYEDALDELLSEYSFSYGIDKEEICFYIGYIYCITGKNSQALKYFSEISNDYKRPYFPDLVLVKGSLLVENLLFDQAIVLFNAYLNNYPGGEKTQYVYFLSAACYKGMNNSNQAKVYLQKAVNENPNSDIGKASALQIEEL